MKNGIKRKSSLEGSGAVRLSSGCNSAAGIPKERQERMLHTGLVVAQSTMLRGLSQPPLGVPPPFKCPDPGLW